MKRIYCALLISLVMNTAWAGPEEDAQAARLRKDYVTALKIVRPLAKMNVAWAQRFLGNAYSSSEGVELDDVQATKLFQLAADQGDVLAQKNLGVMYYFGRGIKQDFRTAGVWFKIAAERGDAEAQFNIGSMYLDGAYSRTY